jgi:hypothetical protein
MSTTPMVPMLSPDGQIGDVPQDRVQEAIAKGFKVGADLTDPNSGKVGVVPLDRVPEAIKSGFQLPRTPEEEASNTRQMLVSGLTGMPTPNMTAREKAQFAQGKAAGAISVPLVAGMATGASQVAHALPGVIPATVHGVKAVGTWASAHPIQAYILYKILLEHTALSRFIKGAPNIPGGTGQ